MKCNLWGKTGNNILEESTFGKLRENYVVNFLNVLIYKGFQRMVMKLFERHGNKQQNR